MSIPQSICLHEGLSKSSKPHPEKRALVEHFQPRSWDEPAVCKVDPQNAGAQVEKG